MRSVSSPGGGLTLPPTVECWVRTSPGVEGRGRWEQPVLLLQPRGHRPDPGLRFVMSRGIK